jgi:hypothetical protein
LVASSASGGVTASSFWKTSRLSSSFSGTASTMSPQPAKSSSLSDDDRRPLPALAPALEELLDAVEAAVDEFLRDVVDERLVARLRRDLRDARAHRAGAEDADFDCFVAHGSKVSSFWFRVSRKYREFTNPRRRS